MVGRTEPGLGEPVTRFGRKLMNGQLVNVGSLRPLSNASSLEGTSENRFCQIVVKFFVEIKNHVRCQLPERSLIPYVP